MGALLQSCFSMVQAHERAAKVRFDWVVKSRPDLLWLRPAPPARFLNASAVHLSAWDTEVPASLRRRVCVSQ